MVSVTRRGLLIGGGIVAGAALAGLAVGFGYLSMIDVEGLRPAPPEDDQPVRLNAWIEVLKDGRVRVAAPHTELGQGIHTGLACVGNMGAEVHFNYSAVGDTVNIAARIEAACKDVSYDVLISDSTAATVPGMALLEAGALSLRGRRSRTRQMSFSTRSTVMIIDNAVTPRKIRPTAVSRVALAANSLT